MDVNEVLELAECYIHQLSQHRKLPDEIKTIINDPLLARLETMISFKRKLIFNVVIFMYYEVRWVDFCRAFQQETSIAKDECQPSEHPIK